MQKTKKLEGRSRGERRPVAHLHNILVESKETSAIHAHTDHSTVAATDARDRGEVARLPKHQKQRECLLTAKDK